MKIFFKNNLASTESRAGWGTYEICRMLPLTWTSLPADVPYMDDRRFEPRILCADLVEMTWREKGGRRRTLTANLEDISLSGACVQTDVPVPLQTEVEISYPKGELNGLVRYCIFRDVGYFVGLEFSTGCRWSKREFKPQHMLDPRRLVARAISRQRREQP